MSFPLGSLLWKLPPLTLTPQPLLSATDPPVGWSWEDRAQSPQPVARQNCQRPCRLIANMWVPFSEIPWGLHTRLCQTAARRDRGLCALPLSWTQAPPSWPSRTIAQEASPWPGHAAVSAKASAVCTRRHSWGNRPVQARLLAWWSANGWDNQEGSGAAHSLKWVR